MGEFVTVICADCNHQWLVRNGRKAATPPRGGKIRCGLCRRLQRRKTQRRWRLARHQSAPTPAEGAQRRSTAQTGRRSEAIGGTRG